MRERERERERERHTHTQQKTQKGTPAKEKASYVFVNVQYSLCVVCGFIFVCVSVVTLQQVPHRVPTL